MQPTNTTTAPMRSAASPGEVADKSRQFQLSASTSDDEVYEMVANEIDEGSISKGLWTRLYLEAEGDENKTRFLYIKHRSSDLLARRENCIADEVAKREAARREREARLDEEKALAEAWGISLEDAGNAVRYRIVKDGAQYAFGGFRYDKLSDAIAYARRTTTPYAR
jgi:hypothetical protein